MRSIRFGTAKVRKFAVIIERDRWVILYTEENLIIWAILGNAANGSEWGLYPQ